MQSLSKANIQVKTLFSLLDHFAIMLGYFWNSFTREKKYTGRHEMSLWKNYLIFFGCKKKKNNPSWNTVNLCSSSIVIVHNLTVSVAVLSAEWRVCMATLWL